MCAGSLIAVRYQTRAAKVVPKSADSQAKLSDVRHLFFIIAAHRLPIDRGAMHYY